MSRLRPVDGRQDIADELTSNWLILVIDLNQTDSNDCNHFIYSVCKNILDKYSIIGPEVSRSGSNSPTLISSNLIDQMMDFGYSDQPMADLIEHSVENSQQTLEDMHLSSDDESDSSEWSDDMYEDINPLIVVVDGINSFNMADFRRMIDNSCQLKDITYTNVIDCTQILSLFHNELILHMSLNPNLKLIIIYVNPSFMYRNIAEAMVSQLSSFATNVNVVLIVDKLTESQRTDFLNNPLIDIISISSDRNRIQIKSVRNDNTVERDLIKCRFN